MDVLMRGMRPPYHNKWTAKKTGQVKYSPIWSIVYNVHGKPIRESSHSTKESDAWKLLKKRHGEIALGKPVGPDIEKTTFEMMAAMIVADYRANGRKSIHKLEDCLNHLRAFFGDYRAVEITGDRVTLYITTRQSEKAASGHRQQRTRRSRQNVHPGDPRRQSDNETVYLQAHIEQCA